MVFKSSVGVVVAACRIAADLQIPLWRGIRGFPGALLVPSMTRGTTDQPPCGGPSAQGWRFPARELEQAVIDPLAAFLRDAGRLMEALPASPTPDQLRQMLDRARSAAGTLQNDHAEQG